MDMKLLALGGAALLAVHSATPALAASPNLSGTYTYHEQQFCQANQSFTVSGKTVQVDPQSDGDVNFSIGTITFTPKTTGAQSGKFSASFAGGAEGSLLITNVDGNQTGHAMNPDTAGKTTGKYSMKANSLTVTPKGQATQKITATFGQLDNNGTAGDVELTGVDSEDPTCGNALQFQRQ